MEFKVTLQDLPLSGHQSVSGHFLESWQETGELICDYGSFSLCLRSPHGCQKDGLGTLPMLCRSSGKVKQILQRKSNSSSPIRFPHPSLTFPHWVQTSKSGPVLKTVLLEY